MTRLACPITFREWAEYYAYKARYWKRKSNPWRAANAEARSWAYLLLEVWDN